MADNMDVQISRELGSIESRLINIETTVKGISDKLDSYKHMCDHGLKEIRAKVYTFTGGLAVLIAVLTVVAGVVFK